MTLPRFQGDGHPTGSLQPCGDGRSRWEWQIPVEGQHPAGGSAIPRRTRRARFPPALSLALSLVLGVWLCPKGLILQKKNVTQQRSQNSPPASRFLFRSSLAPEMSLWARLWLPSLPVSGCLAPAIPGTAQTGDSRSVWFLAGDMWVAGKARPGQRGDTGTGWGQGRDRWAEDTGKANPPAVPREWELGWLSRAHAGLTQSSDHGNDPSRQGRGPGEGRAG